MPTWIKYAVQTLMDNLIARYLWNEKFVLTPIPMISGLIVSEPEALLQISRMHSATLCKSSIVSFRIRICVAHIGLMLFMLDR